VFGSAFYIGKSAL